MNPQPFVTCMAKKSHGVVLLLVGVALLQAAATAGATTFNVGGSGDWSVPGPNSYNQWAERNRFKIGDSLLFVYPHDTDSVLQVDKDAYDACNTTAYLEKYDDGHTLFTFNRSGPFYFISGVEANCMKNESLHVVVLANRSKPTPNTPPPSLAPSPPPTSSSSSPPPPSSSEPSSAPPPAPSSDSPPSQPASPVPGSTAEAPPAEAPSAEGSNPPPPPPPPSDNGASSLKVVGSLGAVIGLLWLCL